MWEEDEDIDSFDEDHDFEPSDDSLAEFADFEDDESFEDHDEESEDDFDDDNEDFYDDDDDMD